MQNAFVRRIVLTVPSFAVWSFAVRLAGYIGYLACFLQRPPCPNHSDPRHDLHARVLFVPATKVVDPLMSIVLVDGGDLVHCRRSTLLADRPYRSNVAADEHSQERLRLQEALRQFSFVREVKESEANFFLVQVSTCKIFVTPILDSVSGGVDVLVSAVLVGVLHSIDFLVDSILSRTLKVERVWALSLPCTRSGGRSSRPDFRFSSWLTNRVCFIN